jgi:hypothetical protein
LDETQIAAQVAKNIPVEEPQVVHYPGTTIEVAPQDPGYAGNGEIDEITKYKLFDAFQIPVNMRGDLKVAHKIEFVYRWAAEQSGSFDYNAIRAYVRTIEQSLGYNPNKPAVDRIYEFAQLDARRRQVEQEMRYV